MGKRVKTRGRQSQAVHVGRWLGRTLLAGLGVFLPLAVTLYLAGWLLVAAEQLAAGVIKAALPNGPEETEPYYIPGMGIAVVVIVLFALGLSMRSLSMQRVLEWEDHTLRRIPLVRTLYSSVKDIGQYFTKRKGDEMGQAVIVTLPETSIQLLGFMTRQDGKSLDGYTLVPDPVLVYLPMSYQIGGYLVIVPRRAVEPVQLPFDEAMSFIFMAGMKDIEVKAAQDAPTPAAPTQKRPPARDAAGAKSHRSAQRT